VSKNRAVLETHVAWEGPRWSIESAISRYGFQSDHFQEPFPPQYQNHMTLKVVMEPREVGAEMLRDEFFRVSRRVEQLLAASHLMNYYAETEVYPLANSRSYPCAHPKGTGHLKPTTCKLASRRLAVGRHKANDIHLRLCRQCLDAETGRVGSVLSDWRMLCRSLGMYRVITGTGNEVWTLLLAHPREGREVFAYLDSRARNLGGVEKLTLESCIRFSVGGSHLVEMPRVFSFHAPT
jgi:hypothetical protein